MALDKVQLLTNTGTKTTRNVSSSIECLSVTPTNDIFGRLILDVGDGVNDCAGTAGLWEITITQDGQTLEGGAITRSVGTAVRFRLDVGEFFISNDSALSVSLKSPDSSDTAVAVTPWIYISDNEVNVTAMTGAVITDANIANGAIDDTKLTTAPAGWFVYEAWGNGAQHDIISTIEHQRQRHTAQGNFFYVKPNTGDTHANGARGGWNDPYNSIQDCHDNAVTDSNHDVIYLISDAGAGVTTLTENITLSKRYLQVRGPGRDFILQAASNSDTVTITADGASIEGFRVRTTGAAAGKGVQATSADFVGISGCWFENTQGDSITLTDCSNARVWGNNLQGSGQSGSGDGISILAGAGQTSSYCRVWDNFIEDTDGNGINVDTTGGGTVTSTTIGHNRIFNSTGNAIEVVDSGATDTIITDNRLAGNTGDIVDNGTGTEQLFNSFQYELAAYDVSGVAKENTLANVGTLVLSGLGSGFLEATDSQEALRDAIDALAVASGAGAWTVTVTVDDGTNPLENAVVRYTEGANTFFATTDVNGQATFNLDTATYTVAITKDGYSYAGTTHAVSADATPTYSMSAVNVPPTANPDTVTAQVTFYDESGVKAGVSASAVLVDHPSGNGIGFYGVEQSGTSSVAGIWTWEAYKGGTYKTLLHEREFFITIPSTAADPYEIPNQYVGD